MPPTCEPRLAAAGFIPVACTPSRFARASSRLCSRWNRVSASRVTTRCRSVRRSRPVAERAEAATAPVATPAEAMLTIENVVKHYPIKTGAFRTDTGHASRREIRLRVRELFDRVGLSDELLDRYPHELSGGQQQRVGIARALAPNPELVVLDEPTSALDVSVQAKLINLLRKLKQELDLTQVFISHDLSVIGYLTDRVAVMYLGEIVELGPTQEIFLKPRHPYPGALMSAVPGVDLLDRRTRLMLPGEVPSPITPPPACRLAPRCPFVMDRCRQEKQVLRSVNDHHQVACWRAAEGEISTEDFERSRLALEV